MCMPTQQRQNEPLEQEQPEKQPTIKNIDRLGVSSLFKYAKGFVSTVMIAAYLGQQAKCETTWTTTSWLAGRSERSLLAGSLLMVYAAMLIRRRLTHHWKRTRKWVSDITDSTNSAMTRVSSKMSHSSMRLLSLAGCGVSRDDRAMAISAKEPFLSLDDISKLALSDVKEIFYYAMNITRPTFQREVFASELRAPARKAIDAIDEVTAVSRGGVPLSHNHTFSDDIDALLFAAAVRVFAEWRSVRLVPDGSNQAYAFGMSMARRDLIQNVTKIEAAAHSWLMFHESASQGCSVGSLQTLHSPTLRQVLEHEVKQKIHHRLPRVAEKSGASGLLWTKRQLQYQTSVFANTIQVPFHFPNSKAAVIAAYKSTYDNFHGFFVKHIFQSSFEAAPEASVIFDFMSLPTREDEEEVRTEDMADSDDDDDESWIHLPVEPSDSSSIIESWEQVEQEPNPFEKIGAHFVSEWIKLQRMLHLHFRSMATQCSGFHANSHPSRDVMHVVSDAQVTKLSNQTSKAAHGEIVSYLDLMQPLLDRIDGLIEEYNMNDPTKV